MSAYKVDAAKKIVVIDDSVKATAAEEKDIDRYVMAGYIIKHKSQTRARQAAARAAKDTLTDAAIQEALNNDQKGLEKYLEIKGGKKLIYNDISLPLTAIADFEEKGKGDPLFAALAEICSRHNGLWSEEAEKYLLVHGKKL